MPLHQSSHFFARSIFSLLTLVLIIGIFFRFANLEGKVVWHDEALTISRVSGYYAQEINQNIFNGKLINVEELRKYQQKNPESNFFDIVDILATPAFLTN